MLLIKKMRRQFHAVSTAEKVAEASIVASIIGAPKDLARVLMFSLVTCCAPMDLPEEPMGMLGRILSTADVAPRNPITTPLGTQ